MGVRREIDRITERELAFAAVYATLDRVEAKGSAPFDTPAQRRRRADATWCTAK